MTSLKLDSTGRCQCGRCKAGDKKPPARKNYNQQMDDASAFIVKAYFFGFIYVVFIGGMVLLAMVAN